MTPGMLPVQESFDYDPAAAVYIVTLGLNVDGKLRSETVEVDGWNSSSLRRNYLRQREASLTKMAAGIPRSAVVEQPEPVQSAVMRPRWANP